jgi:molecular chaperone GrpE
MPDAKLTENAEPTAEPETTASAERSAANAPDPYLVLQNLQRENGELKDKLLRALADMENLRRRTDKEVADAKLYGIGAFARDMLSFVDNASRTLENIPAELHESAEPSVKALVEGIKLTERDFLSRLARHSVKKLEPLGSKFDPNFHEALFEVRDDTVPNGTVVKVVEDGYAIGDRVLRPAKVGVSRAGKASA